MLVLGALLMATLYARPGSALHRGWLRWGFLAIGAASFVDAFEQWWSARTDPDRIPFGMNEGVGLSDPSGLSEDYGWSATQLVSRYVALGCACLLALAVVWLLGLRRPRATAPVPSTPPAPSTSPAPRCRLSTACAPSASDRRD